MKQVKEFLINASLFLIMVTVAYAITELRS